MENSSSEKSEKQQRAYEQGSRDVRWMFAKLFAAAILTVLLFSMGFYSYYPNKVVGIIGIAGAAGGLILTILCSYQMWQYIKKYNTEN